MKKRKLKGFFVGVNGEYGVRECADELQAFYDLLNCSYIECPVRVFKGKRLVVICDEEGTLKSDAKLSGVATDKGRYEFLVGNLFVVGSDGENFRSLDSEEIGAVASCLVYGPGEGRNILVYKH